MSRALRILFAFMLSFIAVNGIHAQQPMQMASLQPGHELVLHRVSPSPERPDGPVPQTVRYHFVNAMLLHEVQKQRRLIESQHEQMQTMQGQMEALRQQNSDIEQQMKAVMLRLAAMEKSGQQDHAQDRTLALAK